MSKVLIVEDDQAINNLIRVSLTGAGYDCTCAFDGTLAADLIEEHDYDLVLLDIMLPEIDGYELLDYIKPTGMPVILNVRAQMPASAAAGKRRSAAFRHMARTGRILPARRLIPIMPKRAVEKISAVGFMVSESR